MGWCQKEEVIYDLKAELIKIKSIQNTLEDFLKTFLLVFSVFII